MGSAAQQGQVTTFVSRTTSTPYWTKDSLFGPWVQKPALNESGSTYSPITLQAYNGGVNTSSTIQLGDGNKAFTKQVSQGGGIGGGVISGNVPALLPVGFQQKSIFSTPVYPTIWGSITTPDFIGVNAVDNNALTLQVGKDNTAFTLQSGMSILPTSNNSATVQIGKDNFALASQQNGFNGQATVQIGSKNGAVTLQSNSPVSANLNAAATIQVGSRNKALTDQVANPLTGGVNGSLIAQFGNGNTAVAAQSTGTGMQAMIGANTQATVQVGSGNYALTAQASAASVTNTSVTAQFGVGNHAVTVQK